MWGGLWRAARSTQMRVRGASRAARMVQGDGDGMCVCMARERRACRCATRATGRARGLEAPRERRCAPPRQQGGGLSAAARRSSLLGGHSKAAQNMPNEQPPPKVRALAKKIISTKLETCTKDDTTERGGWASSQKLPALCGLARAWCINMHQLGVLHSLLPPENSLDPPTHRLTQGAMGAGSP